MKSQERHDLKTNALERISAQIAPFFKQYGQRIVLGMCAAALVLAIIVFWTRSSSTKSENAWQAMVASAVSPSDAEGFLTIADENDFEGSQVSVWARLLSAERHYQNGISHYFTDRSTGVKEMELSKKAFEAVLKSDELNDVMRERALFGLARCAETTSEENTQDAITAYETLLKKFPESIYKEESEKRIKVLNSQDAQEFYAWFAKQTTPKPEDLKRPSDGINTDSSGSGPLFPNDSGSDNFNPFSDFLNNKPSDTDSDTDTDKKSDSADEKKQPVSEPVTAPKPAEESTSQPQPK